MRAHGALNAVQQALVVGKDEELLVAVQQVLHIVLHCLDLQPGSESCCLGLVEALV